MGARVRSGLTTARKRAGHTQESLAHVLGVELSTIRQWERGTSDPQPLMWPHIAKELDITTDELVVLLAKPCCQECGKVLAADNTSNLCGPCRQSQQADLDTPPQFGIDFFDTAEFRAAFESRHVGRVFKVYRTRPYFIEMFGKALAQETLGRWLGLRQTRISRLENGAPEQNIETLQEWAEILSLPQRMLWFDLPNNSRLTVEAPLVQRSSLGEDEEEAFELARRVGASDVGDETIGRLGSAVDDLAIAYSNTPPAALLGRIRTHLAYVDRLLDVRKTLAEHSRLLVVGGWLSLLGATVHIDLKQYSAATARLKTAASLARHAGNDEIRAWCFETEAWQVLTDGDYPRALELSRAAQDVAPPGSSAAIQATAQEGRALARLKLSTETYGAIERVKRLVSPMPKPEHPEHHFRYDPDKSVAYTATTLAWLGDPAAEGYAREIIARLAPADDVQKWPRRVASANIDLALALLVTGRLDEACDATLRAVSSGRMVPSNYWRVAEIVKAVEAQRLPEAVVLREAYEAMQKK